MKKITILIFIIVVLIPAFSGILHSQSGSSRLKNIKKWKGEIHYKLDLFEDYYDNRLTFIKLKGLYGRTLERITIDGTVTFETIKKKETEFEEQGIEVVGQGNKFVGHGRVKYNVSIMYISKLGEAVIVHLTDGRGSEKIEPIKEINFLKFNYSDGTYSLRITPGISDEELDAFGVGVDSVSEIKVTKAIINKMEEHKRDIPFPELLKKMFPEVIKNSSRENIAAEAFGIALPSSGYTLKGSTKDERGGIFSWTLTPVRR